MAKTKNVLVVEDDTLIAMMLENFLECLDRTVVGTADSVAAALRVLDEQPVDVVILDMHLLGGERSDAVAEVLNERGIPFVVASGGGLGSGPLFDGRPLLSKPYTLNGLERVLGSL